jgi:hypothetical protein
MQTAPEDRLYGWDQFGLGEPNSHNSTERSEYGRSWRAIQVEVNSEDWKKSINVYKNA